MKKIILIDTLNKNLFPIERTNLPIELNLFHQKFDQNCIIFVPEAVKFLLQNTNNAKVVEYKNSLSIEFFLQNIDDLTEADIVYAKSNPTKPIRLSQLMPLLLKANPRDSIILHLPQKNFIKTLLDLFKAFAPKNIIGSDVDLEKCSKTFVYKNTIQHKIVKCIGLKNVIIVETNDVLLITNTKNVKQVQNFTQTLIDKKDEKINSAAKAYRPWGYYEVLRDEPNYKVKTIVVNAGGMLSVQSHNKRAEHWVVTKGVATVLLNDDTFTLEAGKSIYVPLGAKHSLQNHTSEIVEIVETQVGTYFGEDDIIRYSDIYGRAG